MRLRTQSFWQLVSVTGLVVFLAACANPATPSSVASQPPAGTGSSLVALSASELPNWIRNPSTLPPGKVGKNNCTFPFGQNVPQWNFHPNAGCWEQDGEDGWTRQQFQAIHVPNFAPCGGGPGDATAIRVCRVGGAGQPAPCFDAVTGETGCALCVANPTCH